MSYLNQVKPKQIAVLTTPQEATQIVDGIARTIDELSQVIALESELVRESKIMAARPLEARKSELARRYLADLDIIRANIGLVSAHAASGLARIRDAHASIQSLLENNLAVLSTAHAVAEGIVRQANELVAASMRPSTYGANGRTTQPDPRIASPIMVRKSL